MQFGNPIAQGESLVRPSLRSPNFVAGSSGWSINRDGSAEFNDLTARGAVDVGGIPGIWIGPRTHPDFPPELFADAQIKAAIVFYIDGNDYSYIALSQGASEDWTEYGIVEAGTKLLGYTIGESIFVGGGPFVDAYYDLFFRGLLELDGGAELLVGDGCAFTIDGNQASRGMLDGVRVADGATKYSGTAEALITDASVTGFLVAGRCYEVELHGMARSTIAGDTVRVDIREDNLAGVQRNFAQIRINGANFNADFHVVERFECTADGNKTFVGTARRAAGTGNVTVVASNTVGQVSPLIMTLTDVTDNASMR